MKAGLSFIKMTLVGGVAFLLPLGVVALVVGKLVQIAHPIGVALHEALFPRATHEAGPLVFVALALVGLAFLAGLFARSAIGRRIFGWLEARILMALPPYTLLRQTVRDMAGGAERLAGADETEVVLVRFDDQTAIGFLIGRRSDREVMVYLPGAPSAFSGSVALVDVARVSPCNLTPTDVMSGMRRLGAGLETLGERR